MTNQKQTTSNSRLKQDYIRLKKDPVPYISGEKVILYLYCTFEIRRKNTFICTAEPLHSYNLEWHYCIRGPEDSLYAGGFYHGKLCIFGKFCCCLTSDFFVGCLLFTKDFPFKPPSIYMYTPNGRFKTNKRLCLNISDYHPGKVLFPKKTFCVL